MSNLQAFLKMITISELTQPVIDGSDSGYNVLVGSTQFNILVFSSYNDHPRVYNKELNSTAAGAYQIMAHIYDSYKVSLNLPDFSPVCQDAIAVQLIKECHALDDINNGAIESAIMKCGSRWASLPNNNYGQHENKIATLVGWYNQSL